MTAILRQIQLGQPTQQVAKICGLCESPQHHTDMCPLVLENNTIAAFNTYNTNPYTSQTKPPFNQNTYHPNNRNHPNFSWSNTNNTLNPPNHPQPQQTNRYQPPHTRQPYTPNYNPSLPQTQSQPSWETTLKKAMEMLQFTQNQLQEQQQQIKELAEKINLSPTAPAPQLPSQTIPNPKGGNPSINLVEVEHMDEDSEEWAEWDDGIDYFNFDPVKCQMHEDEYEDENMYLLDKEEEEEDPSEDMEAEVEGEEDPAEVEKEEDPKEEDPEEWMEIEEDKPAVNCYNLEQVPHLPKKFEDPGPYLLDCKIGGSVLKDCICDPGAAVNIIPASWVERIGLEGLVPTRTKFVMANHSSSFACGIIRDVIVSVEGLLFPADFYVMRAEGEEQERILLGRPFLKTARFELDAYSGNYSVSDGREKVFFFSDQDEAEKALGINSVPQCTPEEVAIEESSVNKEPDNLEKTSEEVDQNPALPSYLPHEFFKTCRRSKGARITVKKPPEKLLAFPCHLPHRIYNQRKRRNREESSPLRSEDSAGTWHEPRSKATTQRLRTSSQSFNPP